MNYIKKIVYMTALLAGLWFSLMQIAQAGQTNDSGCKSDCKSHCKSECKTCAATCEKMLAYCKTQGGKHVSAKHIKALQDCISTCKQSANFMDRDSALQTSACSLCEKACLSCAESCAAIKGDKKMQACADECKKCAQFCHKMVQ